MFMGLNLSLKDYITQSKDKEEKRDEKYLNMPYIKPNTIELREYQKNIIESIDNKNTLVVLPTGLGKTIIAIVLAALRLTNYPQSNILVLAPTKPLVNQHAQSFKKIMDLPEEKFIVISGNTPKQKRKELWAKRGLFFATPQVVKNDLEDKIFSLSDFSLIVFDEAHRSVGDYAYTFIAKKYIEEAKHPLILGLTASPGGEVEKIGSVIGNLFIENVEVRSYGDPDVKPYIKDIEMEWVMVELPPEMKNITALLKAAIKRRVDFLLEKGFLNSRVVSKKELLDLQKKLALKLKEDKSDFLFYVQGMVGQLVKITYSLELVETQGLKQFIDYFEKLKDEKNKTKSLKELLEDEDFTTAYLLAKQTLDKGINHPKMEKIREITTKYLRENSKMIIFTQYVDTAKMITEKLKDLGAVLFVGQRKGYTQKKQIEIIERFRKGEYKILVATSVAEEGLDIPAVDYVIFYEPIPSEIRSIQRRGRTGRFDKGKVIILITKKSLDEAYYWASVAKERNMRRTLHILKRMFSEPSKKVVEVKKSETLTSYASTQKPTVDIIIDHREAKLFDILSKSKGDEMQIKRDTLPVGDIVINHKIVIERKSADDFVNSIIDGRLFSQLDKLVYTYDIPVLIIEGDLQEVMERRDIHENVIRSVLAKIAIEYHVPILWAKSIEDTAQYVSFIAKRQLKEGEKTRYVKIIKKPHNDNEVLESVLSSIPQINAKLSQRLLSKFKTLKKIANAKVEQLMSVEGIGEKKAKKIYEVFNKEWNEGE